MEEDRRILVEDVDDDELRHPSESREEDGSARYDGHLSVGFRPCEVSCLSIVHLASIVAAIGQ